MAMAWWVWRWHSEYGTGTVGMVQIRWAWCKYGGYGAGIAGTVQHSGYIPGTAEFTFPDLPSISPAVPQRLPGCPGCPGPPGGCSASLTRSHPAPAPWAAPGSNPTHEQEKPTKCYQGRHRCRDTRQERPRWGQEGQGRGKGSGGVFPFQAGL